MYLTHNGSLCSTSYSFWPCGISETFNDLKVEHEVKCDLERDWIPLQLVAIGCRRTKLPHFKPNLDSNSSLGVVFLVSGALTRLMENLSAMGPEWVGWRPNSKFQAELFPQHAPQNTFTHFSSCIMTCCARLWSKIEVKIFSKVGFSLGVGVNESRNLGKTF